MNWPGGNSGGSGGSGDESRRVGDLLARGQVGDHARLTAWVRGRVQGVGFRWWVRKKALQIGLVGFAENLTDGRVKVVAEGSKDGLGELLGLLEGPGTPGQVAQVTHRWDELRGDFMGFVER